jgi:hypothetical protein
MDMMESSEQSGAGRFVILTIARSGSNWLGSLLDSHPAILCHLELFNDRAPVFSFHFSRREDPAVHDLEARDADPLGFLERVFRQSDGAELIGMKLLPAQNRAVLDAVCRDRTVKVVILRRRNLLASYASDQLAHKKDEWVRLPGLPEKAAERAVFEPRGFVAYARVCQHEFERFRTQLRAADHGWFELCYEDLGQVEMRAELLRFLEVDPAVSLSSPFRRQNDPDPLRRFANPDLVRRHLDGTSFAAMLEA